MSPTPRLLLIDDDNSLRNLFKKILEAEGIQVDTAPDGKTALQKIAQGGYNLILLDIIMPGMDGITVLKKLKTQSSPAKPNGQIIMLSVLDQTGFIATCLTLGASGYLNKTTTGDPSELLSQIKTLLKQK